MRDHVSEHPAEIESNDPEPDRLRSLEMAAKDLTAGGSLHDVLDRIIVGAAHAVPALCHDLAIELPDGSKYSRWRSSCEAGMEALIQLRGDDAEKESGGKKSPLGRGFYVQGYLEPCVTQSSQGNSASR
ncbi:MAG: hypothetical protein JWQ59_489 [Cryobacterium sp.]|nr:hypothetical protein [Cryobacterium sp.]